MKPPFTIDQLLRLFETYYHDMWLAAVIAFVLGIVVLWLTRVPGKRSEQIIPGILASMWLWTALVFFIFYFREICPAAYYYSILFALQSFLLIIATERHSIVVKPRKDIASVAGLVMIIYSMIGYPAVGYFLDHVIPQSPPFGITPGTLVVFTFGICLQLNRVPGYLIILPFIWSVVGFLPAITGFYEETGMIVSGILGFIMIMMRKPTKTMEN